MRSILVVCLFLAAGIAQAGEGTVEFSGQRKRNNVVSDLLEVSSISAASPSYEFARESKGWIFVSAKHSGNGSLKITLDEAAGGDILIDVAAGAAGTAEAMRHVAAGKHQLHVACGGDVRVEKLIIRAIPDLIHCGLGFDAAIKSYPKYDMEFLAKDIVPNITATVVPSNIQLPQDVIDAWHRSGKKFIAEVGINGQAKTSDEHFQYWAGVLDKSPFLDGVIINEFIINRQDSPSNPQRQARAQARHQPYEEAFEKLRAHEKYKDKWLYAYVGGSGNTLNIDDVGKTFVRRIRDCDYTIALERYIFERSSEEGSKKALQQLIDGVADWETKEPGVRKHMTIAFGLFSMPPGGINKLPNVDYHVWMDQQMNVVANHPTMADISGLEWWTSILADEETVRFVGKLYRHYGIEGHTEMLTRDPLFTTHIENADFEKGIEGWTLQPADDGSIEGRIFPRLGRIEGRYMGLGRPADPEHIGDTLLWMKRSEKAPNVFSQTINNLEPGRLYSMKMFSCDYRDLIEPKEKKAEEAAGFIGTVTLDGVEIDTQRSFNEIYPSGPEPRIPVWITYHWKVFRAKDTTAKLTVSDWPEGDASPTTFGQEQAFNFIEIQPYHE